MLEDLLVSCWIACNETDMGQMTCNAQTPMSRGPPTRVPKESINLSYDLSFAKAKMPKWRLCQHSCMPDQIINLATKQRSHTVCKGILTHVPSSSCLDGLDHATMDWEGLSGSSHLSSSSPSPSLLFKKPLPFQGSSEREVSEALSLGFWACGPVRNTSSLLILISASPCVFLPRECSEEELGS